MRYTLLSLTLTLSLLAFSHRVYADTLVEVSSYTEITSNSPCGPGRECTRLRSPYVRYEDTIPIDTREEVYLTGQPPLSELIFNSICQLSGEVKCDNTQRCLRYRKTYRRIIPKCYSVFEVYSYIEGGVDFIKGYSQVPPLPPALAPVSSPKRPSFSELDIDSDLYCAAGIDLKYGHTRSYFHYQQVTPSNTTTLSKTLTTLGETIEAGELFSMQTRYQWISAGLGAEYTWVEACLKFTPMIDANWVDYFYRFSGVTLNGYQNLRTTFDSFFTMRVGARVDYHYRDLCSTQLILMGSPPFLPLTIYEANLSIAYHLYEKDNFRIRPYVGIKWLFIDYNDNNSEHLVAHYEARPAVFVGFNFLM